ncbi:MAG: galactoside O-acetyltransferase [Prevotella sp.]|nr:galactoside O-acetyltransferase [Prevotella sp.]
MEEFRIDLTDPQQADPEESRRCQELCFKINHTMPTAPEYRQLVSELFCGHIAPSSRVMPGITVVRGKNVRIGERVVVMNNCLMMAAGGITIEDDVQVAANAQLITNNHDLYDRHVITCKPVVLKQGCWIGAGASILPGVTVGRSAIVAAASVVTKDVPDNEVWGGVPAHLIKVIPPKGN